MTYFRVCSKCGRATLRKVITTGSHAIIRPDRCLCGRKFRGY